MLATAVNNPTTCEDPYGPDLRGFAVISNMCNERANELLRQLIRSRISGVTCVQCGTGALRVIFVLYAVHFTISIVVSPFHNLGQETAKTVSLALVSHTGEVIRHKKLGYTIEGFRFESTREVEDEIRRIVGILCSK